MARVRDFDHIIAEIENGNLAAVLGEIRLARPADQANFIEKLPAIHQAQVLAGLSASQVSELLEFLTPQDSDVLETLSNLPSEIITTVLERTSIGTSSRVLRSFPKEKKDEILSKLNDTESLQDLVDQEDETAGALITTDFKSLEAGMTVNQAIDTIRRASSQKNVLERLFVVDGDETLVGIVSFRDLLLANPALSIRRLMSTDPISAQSGTPQEECARLMEKYHLEALPIIDNGGKLMGFLSIADVLEVAEEEATKDMYMIFGISGQEDIGSSLFTSIKRRLPWLTLNLLTAFAAAIVVGMFESTIAKAALLAAFLPIIGGQSGNAAIQTVTIIVRSIALGEISSKNSSRVLLKELLLGLAHGISIALITFLGAYVWSNNLLLSAVLGVSMVISIICSGAVGVLIPITLKRMGADPALSAGIFATALTDVFGFFLLLGLASFAIGL
jgi:magnesium transporter|tara:strand:- start:4063 stop:5403 length:1341 start_codon:yes stop_codon:yes gene_type:complete